jgi:hypothetical protein
MQRIGVIAVSLLATGVLMSIADEPQTNSQKPPYERLLKGDDAKLAEELSKKIEEAETADKYDEAIELSERLLALRTNVQGADHWESVNQKWDLHRDQRVAALSPDDRERWRVANRGAIEAEQLETKGEHTKAAGRLEIGDDEPLRRVQQQIDTRQNLRAAGNQFTAELFFDSQNASRPLRQLAGVKSPQDPSGKVVERRSIFAPGKPDLPIVEQNPGCVVRFVQSVNGWGLVSLQTLTKVEFKRRMNGAAEHQAGRNRFLGNCQDVPEIVAQGAGLVRTDRRIRQVVPAGQFDGCSAGRTFQEQLHQSPPVPADRACNSSMNRLASPIDRSSGRST